MDEGRLSHRSELFTVRLWPEDLGENRIEWRGRVQHALGGQTGYFREWSGLVTFIAQVLAPGEVKSNPEIET